MRWILSWQMGTAISVLQKFPKISTFYEFHSRAYKFRAQLCRAIVRRFRRDSQEWLSYNTLHPPCPSPNGKFIVSGAGESYDAPDHGQNRKLPVRVSIRLDPRGPRKSRRGGSVWM